MGMTTMKVANGYASDDVTLTFYCLNDMRIIDYFHAWQSKAVNQEEQEVGYLNDYTYPVIIQALKKFLQKIHCYNLKSYLTINYQMH